MSLETHDIDGDGDPDVVGSDRKGPRAGVFWLENRTGSEWREHPIGAQGEEVMFLDLGDLDGDGKAEVVAAVKPRQVAIFGPPSGSGGLWARRSIELAGLGGHLKAVRVGDINLDGRPDLVVSCEGADRPGSGVLWYEAVAPNHTRWLPRDISGPAGVKFDRLELVDLDQDGDLDVITCEEQENLGVIWYENPARAALRESR